jgi:23S rRNA (pseudouridine1915-N3)-methyltransferase
MQLTLIGIGRRTAAKSAAGDLIAEYVKRSGRFCPCEHVILQTEAALLELAAGRGSARPAHLILLDSRGRELDTEGFAAHLARQRDGSVPRVLLAVGPADGWSAAALAQAHLTLSFGRMTMAHELAQAVLAEQVYRALTLLAGHPYHSGH